MGLPSSQVPLPWTVVRVSGPAAAAPLLQIITRDFLTISAVRPSALAAAARAMLARAADGEEEGGSGA